MARPIYETEETLDREREIITRICHAWRCEAVKLPYKYNLDYALCRGDEILGWCEVRDRNYSWQRLDELGGYMLAYAKWEKAMMLAAISQLPFTLAVQCTDGLRVAIFKDPLPKLEPSIAGMPASKRNDWQDVEPCVFIPIEGFVREIP